MVLQPRCLGDQRAIGARAFPGNAVGARQEVARIARTTVILLRALNLCSESSVRARASPCSASGARKEVTGVARTTVVILRALRLRLVFFPPFFASSQVNAETSVCEIISCRPHTMSKQRGIMPKTYITNRSIQVDTTNLQLDKEGALS